MACSVAPDRKWTCQGYFRADLLMRCYPSTCLVFWCSEVELWPSGGPLGLNSRWHKVARLSLEQLKDHHCSDFKKFKNESRSEVFGLTCCPAYGFNMPGRTALLRWQRVALRLSWRTVVEAVATEYDISNSDCLHRSKGHVAMNTLKTRHLFLNDFKPVHLLKTFDFDKRIQEVYIYICICIFLYRLTIFNFTLLPHGTWVPTTSATSGSSQHPWCPSKAIPVGRDALSRATRRDERGKESGKHMKTYQEDPGSLGNRLIFLYDRHFKKSLRSWWLFRICLRVFWT